MITSKMKFQFLQVLIIKTLTLFSPLAIASGLFFVLIESVYQNPEFLNTETKGKRALIELFKMIDLNFKNVAIFLCNISLFLFLKFQQKFTSKGALYLTSLLCIVQLVIFSCYCIATENRLSMKTFDEHSIFHQYFNTQKIFYAWYIPLVFIGLFYLIKLTHRLIEIIKNRYF